MVVCDTVVKGLLMQTPQPWKYLNQVFMAYGEFAAVVLEKYADGVNQGNSGSIRRGIPRRVVKCACGFEITISLAGLMWCNYIRCQSPGCGNYVRCV